MTHTRITSLEHSRQVILLLVGLLLASLVLVASPPRAAHAAEWTVNPSTGDDSDCTPDSNTYKTISKAVECATSGDTITVEAGTYNESDIVIDKPLTLLGDPGDPNVTGPGVNAPVLDGQSNNGKGFSIESDDVTIAGFTIQNYKGISSAYEGIGVGAPVGVANIVVRDNHFIDNNWADVFAWTNGATMHDNWLVRRNIVEKGLWSSNTNVYGIECTNCSNSTIEYNNVDGGGTGIMLTVQANNGTVTAKNNKIISNSISGHGCCKVSQPATAETPPD